MEGPLSVILSYFWAAIPTAYLVARYRWGIDIRQYGSGNVGTSNLMVFTGIRSGLFVGFIDGFLKGLMPVVLVQLAGLERGWQVAVALAAVSGNNWSPYIRFTGGRGIAVALGVTLGFLLWWQLLMITLLAGIVGFLILNQSALWFGITWTIIPLFTYLVRTAYPLGWSIEMVYLFIGLLVLIAAKRLTANWESLTVGASPTKVLLSRLLLDRDIPDTEIWVQRTPAQNQDTRRGK
jgi:glycerol-3-phosphate acyltransferase PlsY